jgi:hypothetical protein
MKRREPIKRLETTPITPERARELVDLIAGSFDYNEELAGALIELIAGLADLVNPSPDGSREDAALNALMQAYTHSSSFYNNLCDYVAAKGEGKQL